MINYEANQRLWIKAVAIIISVLILTIGGCGINSRNTRSATLVELTKAGVDPLYAECAIESISESNRINCVILSLRNKN